MATVTSTFPTIFGQAIARMHNPLWSNMLNGDVGSISKAGSYPQQTFHLFGGTLGAGGQVTIRGSNKINPDPTVAADWFTCKDRFGNAAVLNALNTGLTLGDYPVWVSPLAAGDGTTNLTLAGFGTRQSA